jgi:hypothetical protein
VASSKQAGLSRFERASRNARQRERSPAVKRPSGCSSDLGPEAMLSISLMRSCAGMVWSATQYASWPNTRQRRPISTLLAIALFSLSQRSRTGEASIMLQNVVCPQITNTQNAKAIMKRSQPTWEGKGNRLSGCVEVWDEDIIDPTSGRCDHVYKYLPHY